ncbi:hypothetical protein AUK22_07590 [bacterium CG2_30_54_10]|nr:MAG: hypothetical protein AUK22_07590 [bacterium CG2_30_54_10]
MEGPTYCYRAFPSRQTKRFLLPALILLSLATSCVNEGNLRFNPVRPGENYNLSGTIDLSELTESDLLTSFRIPNMEIGQITDFTKFTVKAGDRSVSADKAGKFSLIDVPFASDLILSATAGKVVLLLRLYPNDLRLTDVSKLKISLDSTARALIWKNAQKRETELTAWDIAAREYEPLIGSLTFILKLALQTPKKDVPITILELASVDQAAKTAADAIIPREADLREAYSVIQNALLKSDLKILKYYISPEFSNDWDSTSSWNDFNAAMEEYFKKYRLNNASYTISDMEFLPGNEARVRTAGKIEFTNTHSGLDGETALYQSDIFWRREGSFWKITRNLPYREGHPTQLMAGSRWGEIARAHAQLQGAIFKEDIPVLEKIISPNFGNDWDVHSTHSDLLNSAQSRFNACDVKVATYSIRFIDFIDDSHARVHCTAQVAVFRLLPGVDSTTGVVNAVVDWHLESGVWKLFRNLPYKFSHPLNIR